MAGRRSQKTRTLKQQEKKTTVANGTNQAAKVPAVINPLMGKRVLARNDDKFYFLAETLGGNSETGCVVKFLGSKVETVVPFHLILDPKDWFTVSRSVYFFKRLTDITVLTEGVIDDVIADDQKSLQRCLITTKPAGNAPESTMVDVSLIAIHQMEVDLVAGAHWPRILLLVILTLLALVYLGVHGYSVWIGEGWINYRVWAVDIAILMLAFLIVASIFLLPD